MNQDQTNMKICFINDVIREFFFTHFHQEWAGFFLKFQANQRRGEDNNSATSPKGKCESAKKKVKRS